MLKPLIWRIGVVLQRKKHGVVPFIFGHRQEFCCSKSSNQTLITRSRIIIAVSASPVPCCGHSSTSVQIRRARSTLAFRALESQGLLLGLCTFANFRVATLWHCASAFGRARAIEFLDSGNVLIPETRF